MNPTLYKKDDEWTTPKSAWENIIHLLPKDKVYYDPFYSQSSEDGSRSGDYLKDLGLNIIHENVDFFTNQVKYDIIITNPPFSNNKAVLKKLLEDGKPFIMIMKVDVLCSKMYSDFIEEGSIVVPKSRIQFMKNGETAQGKCPFNCFYYFWKMNLGDKLIAL